MSVFSDLFSDSLFSYLSNRSFTKKAIDFFLVAMLVAWIATVYTVAANFDSVKQFFSPKLDVKELIMLDKSINDILQITMEKIDADRGAIARFHNTIQDVQGRHFVYESRSNEVVAGGVAPIAKMRQNLLLSLMNIWAQEFIQNKCTFMAGLKPTEVFYEYYHQSGVKADIKCPVFNTKNDLVGFVVFEFTTKQPSMDVLKNNEKFIRDASAKIGAVLSVRAD